MGREAARFRQAWCVPQGSPHAGNRWLRQGGMVHPGSAERYLFPGARPQSANCEQTSLQEFRRRPNPRNPNSPKKRTARMTDRPWNVILGGDASPQHRKAGCARLGRARARARSPFCCRKPRRTPDETRQLMLLARPMRYPTYAPPREVRQRRTPKHEEQEPPDGPTSRRHDRLTNL